MRRSACFRTTTTTRTSRRRVRERISRLTLILSVGLRLLVLEAELEPRRGASCACAPPLLGGRHLRPLGSRAAPSARSSSRSSSSRSRVRRKSSADLRPYVACASAPSVSTSAAAKRASPSNIFDVQLDASLIAAACCFIFFFSFFAAARAFFTSAASFCRSFSCCSTSLKRLGVEVAAVAADVVVLFAAALVGGLELSSSFASLPAARSARPALRAVRARALRAACARCAAARGRAFTLTAPPTRSRRGPVVSKA